MKQKTYLDLANSAIQAEKEEMYGLAAEYWEKAKNLATNINTQSWAEYRQLHNEKRHSLHNGYSKVLRVNESKRIASELEKHMNKQMVSNGKNKKK
jgi:hypothetical protein